MSVSLQPSVPSPAIVGRVITWTATVSEPGTGVLWYRFRVRPIGWDFRIVKDFGPGNTFAWTAAEHEGSWQIEVTARNQSSRDTAVAVAPYVMVSNALGGKPAVTPTAHPLVFLYSAPPCESGSRMKVRFQSPAGLVQNTPYKRCRAGLSMNFYLAGMEPAAEYFANHVIDTGDAFVDGPVLTLTTGTVPELPETSILHPAPKDSPYPIVLQSAQFANPFATDLEGHFVWYYPGTLGALTRPERGGYFLATRPGANQALQALFEFDLTGMTVLETNAARMNEQLTALGKPTINAFHHEVRRLRDGKIATLGGVERILTDVQGTGPVDVLGDMIIVLDEDLQVVWTWNAFDHLDPARRATLDDRCTPGNCPRTYLAQIANDWTHCNSIAETEDGNLILSIRNFDWVVKIDYQNGYGTGDILWRLGKGGDFQLLTDDPNPWFTHQHDPNFEPGKPSRLMLLDNGNVRHAEDPQIHTRGQVLELDEKTRVARLVLNADLGAYSLALGSAQLLPTGNYLFDVGFLADASAIAREVDGKGTTVFALQSRAPSYRTFRMRDLYTPPD